jgi:hypothetical protein
MAITTGGIVALVAGSSVLAAFINQGITIAKDWWTVRRDASFSALYIAIALESYASDCAADVSDSENHEYSNGHAGSPKGNIRDLPDFDSNIEWKPFGIKRTTQAMSFRIEVETTKTMIRDMWEFDDEDGIVPLVRYEASRLGSKALALAIELRDQWNIDPVDYTSEWNVKKYLEERHAEYVRDRKLREARNQILGAEMLDIVKSDQSAASSGADPA